MLWKFQILLYFSKYCCCWWQGWCYFKQIINLVGLKMQTLSLWQQLKSQFSSFIFNQAAWSLPRAPVVQGSARHMGRVYMQYLGFPPTGSLPFGVHFSLSCSCGCPQTLSCSSSSQNDCEFSTSFLSEFWFSCMGQTGACPQV